MTQTDPLIVSLARLPRAVGSRGDHHIDWVVPSGWSTEVLSLPEGTQISLDVALTSIDDGVLVQVKGNGDLVGECIRCLDPAVHSWELDSAEVYFDEGKVPDAEPEGDIDMVGVPEDQPREITKDRIDLEPFLRDAILAAAPLMPLCRENCQGLCAGCGERLDNLPAGHSHESIDPRLAVLQSLLEDPEGQDS